MPASWDRLQDLYLAALGAPPEARADLVRQGAGGDDALAAEVLAMLLAVPPALLDAPADLRTFARDALDDLPPGTRLGPYRIEGVAGHGGMGTVYRAARADGLFEQTVALKLVKRGMDSAAVLRRFEAERRILARLDHPGIARVLDGGEATDGRPWLAMEFVEGEPIVAFADRQRLGVDARIDLFRQVCEAVAYAHRQLVVHRDLKPSNVLVTADGRAKLLDFGIARVLAGDDETEPLTLLTAPGHSVLTPEYAAPEQIRGEPISTATDVYALGVLLYELLAGRRPYSFDARTPGVIEHVVGTVQPPRPSTVVAETTGTPADRLRRQLAGDLDMICLTALRKEPERRYASAQALADDLQRHRQRLPVRARPDTVGYRMRTFVRRHRGGLAMAGAALGGIALMAVLTFARVRAERDLAQTEAAKAEAVSDFLTGLFTEADPANARGIDVTARELLRRGAERIEADLAGQPQVQAEMLHVTGTVYKNLEALDEAEPLLLRALDLRRQRLGPNHPDVAATLIEVGLLHERRGRYAEAADANAEAVRILRAHSGADPLLLGNALHGLAFAHMRLRRFPEAEREIREAVAIKRSLFGDRHAEVAYSLNILGDVLTHQKRYDEAVATHREALAMRRALLGPDHLHVAFSLHNLAAAYRDMARYAEAETAYRQALVVWRTNYPDDNQQVANTLSQLGFVIGMQGRTAEADTLYGQALALAERALGDAHPQVAVVHIRQGDVRAHAGRLVEAEALYRRGIATRRRARGGDDDPVLARWQATLAGLVGRQGRTAEAERLLRSVEPRCEAAARDGDPSCQERLREVRTGLHARRAAEPPEAAAE